MEEKERRIKEKQASFFTHRGTYLNHGLHRPSAPPTVTQKPMKHYAWKEENKPFSLPTCTGLCYRVTVFITSPREIRKLWCTHTYLAALKMEGKKKYLLSDFRNTYAKAHTSPPSKTVTEVILYSCCSTWRTPASPPAGHIDPYLGTIPVLPLHSNQKVSHGLPLPVLMARQVIPGLQVVAEQAKTRGGRDGSKKRTEQPCQ